MTTASESIPAAQSASRFDAFAGLAAQVPDETVTHSPLTEVVLPRREGRDGSRRATIALITLDNGLDHRRPTTLGPNTLVELGRTLEGLRARAAAGEVQAVAVTGKPGFLVAGADLSTVRALRDPAHGAQMARLGHAAYGLLADLGVPTFAFINGVALGGGLEIALACTYRTVSEAADGIGLPEAHLGLIPGWGGVWRLPRLIGPEAALQVMIDQPLGGNRTLGGREAFGLGIADALFPAGDFLARSLEWAAAVLAGDTAVERPHAVEPATDAAAAGRWRAAAERARSVVAAKVGDAAPAPAALLDVFEAGTSATQAESAELEVATLTRLMQSPEFRDTVYAFLDVVQKRAKRPAGAPAPSLARPVAKVGIIGAGLMASQLALLFARRLGVPVVLTDLDEDRVARGVGHVRAALERLADKGRMPAEEAARVKDLVSGSVSMDAFEGAGLVIEAVFEELSVKRDVLARAEAAVSPECVLATNTSSLSVAAMADGLAHPERVVGFHFFNPVAAMPLVEIVRAPRTDDAALATAFALARDLKKTAVLVRDAPAFVVNRILLRLMGEVMAAFDEGTPAEVADGALGPLGLPMTPFELAALVGLPVAQHVAESLHAAVGERFHVSANQQALIDAGLPGLWSRTAGGGHEVRASTLALLSRGNAPSTSEQVLTRCQDALAEEIGLILAEGVVAGPEDVDLCMILGAGWPLHLGGITPYLDRVGASQRVNGRAFHARG
ncbi:3-hydroxyacyl-CoA dehydrogenase NAD-binding domain-containing protein [Sinomonas mesophila]|uniref:3-hydroxyacyl-CoA dehydrogenase NAD-binding domain-containing protein n=1 Tax=Sinomonas mesophila TaxID=1531955 RepID=UPI0009864F4F|nr:3-hydroxyacyl-CoA dehydrogenase NAD-binding domain-containing protein [Sinomonas mesophila]